jgi:predicted ATPase
MLFRGWCFVALQQTAKGIPLLLQGLAAYRVRGSRLYAPPFLMMVAEAYGVAAQPEEGLGQLGEAAQLIETTHERWAEPELHRVRAELLLSINKYRAAETGNRHALSLARRQSAKLWELRAALGLARLWKDQGKGVEARELLAPIYGWFNEGFDTPVLQDAKELLDQLA